MIEELSVYEYEDQSYLSPRRLVIAYERAQLELDRKLGLNGGQGYIVPLKLVAGEKTIVELLVSTHALHRLAHYLRTKTWQGGHSMFPKHSEPDCTIHALSELPHCDEWGLAFVPMDARPLILVAWVPSEEARQTAAQSLHKLASQSVSLRKPEEPKEPQDLYPWKQHLFGIEE